jgi:hypothetical protein
VVVISLQSVDGQVPHALGVRHQVWPPGSEVDTGGRRDGGREGQHLIGLTEQPDHAHAEFQRAADRAPPHPADPGVDCVVAGERQRSGGLSQHVRRVRPQLGHEPVQLEAHRQPPVSRR